MAPLTGEVMRMAPLTGEIQIVEASVLGFSGGADRSWRIGDLTRMPPRE